MLLCFNSFFEFFAQNFLPMPKNFFYNALAHNVTAFHYKKGGSLCKCRIIYCVIQRQSTALYGFVEYNFFAINEINSQIIFLSFDHKMRSVFPRVEIWNIFSFVSEKDNCAMKSKIQIIIFFHRFIRLTLLLFHFWTERSFLVKSFVCNLLFVRNFGRLFGSRF